MVYDRSTQPRHILHNWLSRFTDGYFIFWPYFYFFARREFSSRLFIIIFFRLFVYLGTVYFILYKLKVPTMRMLGTYYL